jgi:type II secretory pathway pseudopilin PulG
MSRTHYRLRHYRLPRSAQAGVTVLELLVILAIVAVIATIGVFNGRRMLQGQEERAAIASVQQAVWQGATNAAARGVASSLYRSAETLTLQDGSGRVLRRFTLPRTVTTNLPSGLILTFTPPGKVEPSTLAALPDPLLMSASGKTTRLTISLIGEVRAEALP